MSQMPSPAAMPQPVRALQLANQVRSAPRPAEKATRRRTAWGRRGHPDLPSRGRQHAFGPTAGRSTWLGARPISGLPRSPLLSESKQTGSQTDRQRRTVASLLTAAAASGRASATRMVRGSFDSAGDLRLDLGDKTGSRRMASARPGASITGRVSRLTRPEARGQILDPASPLSLPPMPPAQISTGQNPGNRPAVLGSKRTARTAIPGNVPNLALCRNLRENETQGLTEPPL